MPSLDRTKCPIWGTELKEGTQHISSRGVYRFNSPRAGGKMEISLEAMEDYLGDDPLGNPLSVAQKAMLSRWIYEDNCEGVVPLITSNKVENKKSYALVDIEKSKPSLPTVPERINLYLEWLVSKTRGDISEGYQNAFNPESMAASWTTNERDHEELIKILYGTGYAESRFNNVVPPDSDSQIRPSLAAYKHYQEEMVSESNEVFIAMWLDKKMDGFFNHIEQALEKKGFKAVRIDRKNHNNRIDDEIIASIRQCRFIIADFTSNHAKDNILIARGGVYYEAGFAHGLGKEVIFTAREDCIKDVHFDTRQQNHILWEQNKEKEFVVYGQGKKISLGDAIIHRIGALDL